MVRMDRIEGSSTVSSTPISSAVAAAHNNVTFRLPKPPGESTSPGKNTIIDIMPRSNLINSYKWPAREELLHSGYLSLGLGFIQMATSHGTATEPRQGYFKDPITPSVDKLQTLLEVSNVVSNMLADYEAPVQQEVIPGKPLTTRRKSGRYNREVANNILENVVQKMQHKLKQNWGRGQRDKALFNVKYVTAGTFHIVK